jgi:hypothetical protein
MLSRRSIARRGARFAVWLRPLNLAFRQHFADRRVAISRLHAFASEGLDLEAQVRQHLIRPPDRLFAVCAAAQSLQ